MTRTIGVRELARNTRILDDYDYVEVEDKKTHEYKGLFVSPKYAKEFKSFLEDKISQDIQKKLDKIDKYAGSVEIEDRFKNLSYKEIRAKIAKEKYAQ